jgi:hypothetical protein
MVTGWLLLSLVMNWLGVAKGSLIGGVEPLFPREKLCAKVLIVNELHVQSSQIGNQSVKTGEKTRLLWRFPFAILYSEEESVITVWPVARGSRRPEYWGRRL